MKTQLDFISKKSNFLFVKLYPYLANASTKGRKDMWRAMVSSLFNGLLSLLYFESAESHNKALLKLWRSSFKRFLLIPKNTSNDLVDEMIGIDIKALRDLNAENSARKWDARCDRTEPQLLPREKPKDYLRGIPKEWCEILKQQFSICPSCKNNITSAKHMEDKHGIEILSYKIIWNLIKGYYDTQTELQKKKNKIMKVKRKLFLEEWKPILEKVRNKIQEKLDLVFNRNNRNEKL